jgi:uncharacterized protein YodC (DUF2158 family)
MLFEIGDRVVLISGGPLMTVMEDTNGSPVKCVWFDDNKMKQIDEFPAATLRNIDSKPKQ